MSDYRAALELTEDDHIFQIEPKGQRRTSLTRWDKLSIYLAVTDIDSENKDIIFEKIKHRKTITKPILGRFLRKLVKAKAIHEIPDMLDMRRVSYRKRME